MTSFDSKQLEADLAEATKKRDQVRLTVLRLLKTALKNYEIEVGHDASNAEILKILQSEAKKRQDSISQYKAANRDDLVKEETSELDIITQYLPAQLSDQELDELVTKTIKKLNATDTAEMGKVIKEVLNQANGRADGSTVSAKVKQALRKK